MDIARPKEGFHLREPSEFGQIIKDASNAWPRLPSQWEGIKERLKITAHREGVRAGGPGERVFEAQGDVDGHLPAVRVAYHVLGDTVTFLKIDILEPDDTIL